MLLDNAQFLPLGTRTRTGCATGSFSNNCGWGLDIVTDRWRQLRTASYAAQESGVYYLTVTRHEDETVKETVTDPATGVVTIVDTGKGGPVYSPLGLADKWGVDIGFVSGPGIVAYLPLLGGGFGSVKRAMPYYELSVQVHGPTLASLQIRKPGDQLSARALRLRGAGAQRPHGSNHRRDGRARRRHRQDHPR